MTGLKDIFGQDAAIDWMIRTHQAGRLPHGLIFAGQDGVGKETTARALANLFLCEKPKESAACDKCESCRAMISAGPTHPDYHPIYRQLIRFVKDKEDHKARDLAIDVIRDFLIAPALRQSSLGVGKVFVVREAALMNVPAQNCLLKVLEEPYGKTLIILLTDDPLSLLPTIRSRCQLISFARLDDSMMRRQLEKCGVDAAQIAATVEVAEGSLGNALTWIADGVVERAGELFEQIDAIVRGNGAAGLPEWFKAASDALAERILKRDEKASKDQITRECATLYFRLAALRFRHVLASTSDADELERACACIDALAESELLVASNVGVSLVYQQLASALERRYLAQSASMLSMR